MLQSLDTVAQTIHNDLRKAKRNNDYITDENAARMKQVAKSLKQAGLQRYHMNIKTIVGSFAGDAFGEWVVDITYATD